MTKAACFARRLGQSRGLSTSTSLFQRRLVVATAQLHPPGYCDDNGSAVTGAPGELVQRAAPSLVSTPESTVSATVGKIAAFLEEAAGRGADVLVLPEACVTGYDAKAVQATTPEEIQSAEEAVRAACKRHNIAAVFGAPYYEGLSRRCYNSAVLVGKDGSLVGRQSKMQLVPPDWEWCSPGHSINVYEMFPGVLVAAIICHDKRYPELVRLPVLAGARVIFYLSCESWHDDLPLPAPREPKWSAERLDAEVSVYRAQIQARAVENGCWIVKANTAGCRHAPLLGSHGKSGVIDPTGMVVSEASIFREEIVVAEIDIDQAKAPYAKKSLLDGYFLSSWWKQAVEHVKVHKFHTC